MKHLASKTVAAFWLTATQRAYRAAPAEAVAPSKRRPFSRSKAEPQPGSGSPLKTARIYPFTGSNTPYQSHE